MEDRNVKGMFALIELSKTRGFEITPSSSDDNDCVEVNGIRLDYLDHTAEDIKEIYSQKCNIIYSTRSMLINNGHTCVGSPRIGFAVDDVAVSSEMMLNYSYNRLMSVVSKTILANLKELLDKLLLTDKAFTGTARGDGITKIISATEDFIKLEAALDR